MRTIWKFPLLGGVQQVTAPGLGRLLTVAVQSDGQPMLWAEVEPGQPMRESTVTMCGTGHPVPRNGHYLGTIFDGPFVWHWYGSTPVDMDRDERRKTSALQEG